MKKRILVVTLSLFFILSSFTPVLASSKSLTPSGIAFSEIEGKIDEHVNKYIGKTTPGAAVAVIKDGKIIFSKGYGYKDIEKKTLIDPKTTVFEYASISKLFIWTSVMQLVEQGKLNLNEDIKKYLPRDFSSKLKYKKPITMLNLMNHTGGFEEYVIDLASDSSKPSISLEEALIRFEPKQIYEPGTVSAYSNYGASLAGYVVEKISGEEFSTYVGKNIFSPCNMSGVFPKTTAGDNEKLEDIKARGYMKNGDGTFKKVNWSNITLYPAGAVNGTLEDLSKYAIALTPKNNENSVLFKKRETLDSILTKSSEKDMPLSTSYGFFEYDGEGSAFGHGGNTAGFSTNIVVVPSESFGVVVFSNAWSESKIRNGIIDLLIEKKDREESIGAVSSTKNLTDSRLLEGQYITSRRNIDSFLEVKSYVMDTMFSVKSLDENKIQLSFKGFNESYVQIRPNVYKLIETPSSKRYFPSIYFDVKDGKVNYLSLGEVSDYTPLPKWRTRPWLIFSLVILVVSAIYFIMSPFILFIQKLINKKKKREFSRENIIYKRIHVVLTLLGSITLINNIAIFGRMLSDYFTPSTLLNPHLILNWVLLFIEGVLIVLLLLKYKKSNLTKWQKIFSVITVIITILFMYLLINWNFLTLLK